LGDRSLDLNLLSLPPAQTAGKKENQENKQDQAKPAPADQGSAEVKSAAAEQEHQYNQNNK
jgi:hypothetical protein